MLNVNIWLILGSIFVVLGALGGMYLKGRSDCQMSVQVKELSAVVESEDRYEKISQEVIRLPVNDLRKRYCKWVRDGEDLCLQANIPIP